mmetsp:Transcript_26763/g.61672  ORF Transcript_26763/g.61672 Transcript_26763/m.61672 type:complete len:262 (-) Transcript_26763:827-1612(-)
MLQKLVQNELVGNAEPALSDNRHTAPAFSNSRRLTTQPPWGALRPNVPRQPLAQSRELPRPKHPLVVDDSVLLCASHQVRRRIRSHFPLALVVFPSSLSTPSRNSRSFERLRQLPLSGPSAILLPGLEQLARSPLEANVERVAHASQVMDDVEEQSLVAVVFRRVTLLEVDKGNLASGVLDPEIFQVLDSSTPSTQNERGRRLLCLGQTSALALSLGCGDLAANVASELFLAFVRQISEFPKLSLSLFQRRRQLRLILAKQ